MTNSVVNCLVKKFTEGISSYVLFLKHDYMTFQSSISQPLHVARNPRSDKFKSFPTVCFVYWFLHQEVQDTEFLFTALHHQQECIPVGCVPSAAVAILGDGVSTRHPPEQTPPGPDTPGTRHPPRADPPGNRHPRGADTPQSRHPPRSRHPREQTHTRRDQTPPPPVKESPTPVKILPYPNFVAAVIKKQSVRSPWGCPVTSTSLSISPTNSNIYFLLLETVIYCRNFFPSLKLDQLGPVRQHIKESVTNLLNIARQKNG